MNKSDFLKIFDSYYDLTDGKPQSTFYPDVKIELNSISWSIKIDVFIDGYTRGDKPTYSYRIDSDTSDQYVKNVLHILNMCKKIRNSKEESLIKIIKEEIFDFNKNICKI